MEHATLRDKIKAGKSEREALHAFYAMACAIAHKAGVTALESAKPEPMVVVQPSNPLDDNSAPKNVWFVPGGPCGFAWVSVRGNQKFSNWAVKNGWRKSSYYGGVQLSVTVGGQSMELKEIYAEAFAESLRKHDIVAYAHSRMG